MLGATDVGGGDFHGRAAELTEDGQDQQRKADPGQQG
jgi:hypothetical protein